MERLPWLRRGFAPVLCVLLVLLAQVADSYTQYIVNLALIYVVIGVGLNFLLGYAGQFAFAHAALMGIGAYTTALLTSRLYWSFWLCLPLSGVVAAALGALGALPAMRMKRVYLALVTLAFAQLVVWVLVNWNVVTLGTDGVDVPAPMLFGWRVKGDTSVFYVVLPCTALMYWLAKRILESRIGRAFVTIRENEIVARCNGINVARTKTVVFALSAFYAGIGGSLYALTLGFIVPDAFGLSQLVLHFSIVVLGGLLSLSGAAIGAVVLTALPELLRDLQALQEIIYGLVLMVVILVMPQGIAGLLKRWGVLPREVLARNWRALARETP
ncbi:MAG: branched-chain amino acid ABC transporter permease [Acidisphaera sp.]|nr:branched-chain amino acid ABC transporter permease [Acidisphaera sp.]